VRADCSFDPVFSILKICVTCFSCLSLNVCLIIQIWMGLLLNGDMYKSISEMVSKFSKSLVLKLWFSQLCWYRSHCLQLRGLNKKNRNTRMINKTLKQNIGHICFSLHSLNQNIGHICFSLHSLKQNIGHIFFSLHSVAINII
jgi:hypothetical protein